MAARPWRLQEQPNGGGLHESCGVRAPSASQAVVQYRRYAWSRSSSHPECLAVRLLRHAARRDVVLLWKAFQQLRQCLISA